MSEFKIVDFDKVIISGIEPTDELGDISDATSAFFKTDTVTYTLNPLTILLTKLSDFEFYHWNEYTESWIDLNFPEPIILHMQNHFRALSVYLLLREDITMDSFFKILNIVSGKPFALFEGECSSIETVEGYYYITQKLGNNESFIYKVPSACTLNVAIGSTISLYSPLIQEIIIKDVVNTQEEEWFSEFDSENIIPLVDVKNIDFAVAKNKIVGVTIPTSRYPFSYSYLEKILMKISPKNIILFVKFIN